MKVECWPDSTVYGNQTIMTPIIDSKMVCTYEEPDIDPTAILAANGDILSLVEGHTKDGYHLVEDEPTLFLFNSFFETAT